MGRMATTEPLVNQDPTDPTKATKDQSASVQSPRTPKPVVTFS